MSEGKLDLKIITPDGRSLHETGVDVVVFRRREKRFEAGSEIAIFPQHAPTLIRMPIGQARYRKGSELHHLAVGGGFVEVKKNRILMFTPRYTRIPDTDPKALEKSRQLVDQWRKESTEFADQMIGYA